MTVLKNWCKLDIDADKLDIDFNKHEDWNLVFAHHKEEDEIPPIAMIEIAEVQHKDQELKFYFKKSAKNGKKGFMFPTY
jgi:hypothetical protein